jgi:tetratricopeptide (TPR) repeat protein
MPTYLWSAKDSSGKEILERISAASPEEASDQLLGRGLTNLQLRTSEIHDFVKKGVEAASNPAYRPKLTAREELALLHGTGPGFWARWWRSTRESAGPLVLIGLLLAVALYGRAIPHVLLFGGLFLFVLLLFPVLNFWFGRPGRLFRELHHARTWRRWTEVLALLEKLRRVQKSRKIGMGEAAMARYRSLALAGLGKLDEAVNCFTEAADTADMPHWMLLCHLAGIYTVAGRYDSGLDCYRQALDVATEKGVVCIDYGSYLVQRYNRPTEARKMLEIAESGPLTESSKDHVSVLKGLIALREGDFLSAKEHMTRALSGLESHPKAKYFVYEPSILLAHGYLALINAALGDNGAAQKHFIKSEMFLQTIQLSESY